MNLRFLLAAAALASLPAPAPDVADAAPDAADAARLEAARQKRIRRAAKKTGGSR